MTQTTATPRSRVAHAITMRRETMRQALTTENFSAIVVAGSPTLNWLGYQPENGVVLVTAEGLRRSRLPRRGN